MSEAGMIQSKTTAKRKSGSQRRAALSYKKNALKRATEAILGKEVVGVEYPGGKNRDTIRMLLQEGSVIATRRSNVYRARIETAAITALNKHDAPVPKLLGSNHSQILIQEEIVGTRLSRALEDSNQASCYQLLKDSLSSISSIQHAASAENLERYVDTLGADDHWIETFIGQPGEIGARFNVKAPILDLRQLIPLLRVVQPRFVKWDTRPGNALVNKQGHVIWFDWEHAGKRNRIDDMAWILCDEFVPEYPDVENRLVDEMLPLFSESTAEEAARTYLMLYGCLHIAIRLGLILKHMKGEWWTIDYCIDNDKIGVTLECAQRLCNRGERWAAHSPLTKDLTRWFSEMGAVVGTL